MSKLNKTIPVCSLAFIPNSYIHKFFMFFGAHNVFRIIQKHGGKTVFHESILDEFEIDVESLPFPHEISFYGLYKVPSNKLLNKSLVASSIIRLYQLKGNVNFIYENKQYTPNKVRLILKHFRMFDCSKFGGFHA